MFKSPSIGEWASSDLANRAFIEACYRRFTAGDFGELGVMDQVLNVVNSDRFAAYEVPAPIADQHEDVVVFVAPSVADRPVVRFLAEPAT